ncbi:MAG: hypothetical protein KA821_16570 [Chitinophagaceae bacterium]|nr:hypothetical protein [Chitinophagaceae bacterium]
MACVQKNFDKSIGTDREHYLKIDEPAQHIDEAGRGIYDRGIGGKRAIAQGKQPIVGADILFTD